MTENLFNIDELSDLPQDLAEEIKTALQKIRNKSNTQYFRVLELMKLVDRPLKTTEISVGYYRKFGKELRLKSATSVLSRLMKAQMIELERRGLYKIKNN